MNHSTVLMIVTFYIFGLSFGRFMKIENLMGCACAGTSNTDGNKWFTETKNKYLVPQMYPLDLNWAAVNSGQIVHAKSTKELFCSALVILVQLLIAQPAPGRKRTGRPWAAALSAAGARALRSARSRSLAVSARTPRDESAWKFNYPWCGPCSAARGSFSCWGWSRKEAVAVFAEFPPVGMTFDWLFNIAEVLNWGKNNLDVHETYESYHKHTITAICKVSHISCSCIWLIIWAFSF